MKEIAERLGKLEKGKDGGVKFFVQYLLSPLLVVMVWLLFNWQIESSKKEVQQLQLAYSMLNTLFSDDEIKTITTKRLMDEVITREDLKNAIGIMVD